MQTEREMAKDDVTAVVGETLAVLSKIINKFDDGSISEEDQDVALECFVKLFAKVELSDHMGILSFAVGLLAIRPTGESLPIQCKICLSLCKLIKGNEPSVKVKYGKWKEIITNELVSETINIFKTVESMLKIQTPNISISNKKISSCVTLLATILDSNAYVKKAFNENLGVARLKTCLSLHENMNEEVANSLLELLTVSNSKDTEISQRVITLRELVVVIIMLIPHFDDIGQRKICETIRVMCATNLQNRLICCSLKLISTLLELLEHKGQIIPSSNKDCLISTMEILGCLSISSEELKLLISLFQKESDDKKQFSHGNRLVQSLERMASQNAQHHSQYQPQYFIDFYNIYRASYIKSPTIQRWNGKGITVHTWICLDFTLPNAVDVRQCKVRHMLFCFLNARGEGFEAFFTEDGFLVLASHTRKEYLTTTVTSSPFNDQEWHGLSIVYTKKLLGKATVAVYVDGQEIHFAPLQFPTLNKEITHSYIGYGVKSDSRFNSEIHPPSSPTRVVKDIVFPDCIVTGQQNQTWGIPSSLKGQLSSFILFNESLSTDKVREIALSGPNNSHLFTSKDVLVESPVTDTAGLLSSVVFYFNAKASVEDEIMDLSTAHKDKIVTPKNLKGTIYHVWSIQESIQSLGGLSVLFPLLEQTCFKSVKKSKTDYSILDLADEAVAPDAVSNNRDHLGSLSESVEALEPIANVSSNKANASKNSETSVDFQMGLNDTYDQELINGNNIENELDETDGKKVPVLSDLPVLYSPRHDINLHVDPMNWTSELDHELGAVAVTSENDVNDAGSKNTFQRSYSNSSQDIRKKAGSFVLLGSPPSSSKTSISSEWTLLDPKVPRTRSETFKCWAKQDNHDLNGVAHFISLIRYMIGSRKQIQDMTLDLQGIKVIGLLLQECDPGLMNIGFLDSVAQLVESLLGVKDELLEAVYKFILFDFKIWCDADISVQIAHTQLLHTYIKNEPLYFSSLFGIDYFIRVIEECYCDKELQTKKKVQLTESEERDLRNALLGLIFYLLKLTTTKNNMDFIISYMASVSKHEHLDEILDFMEGILKTGANSALETQLADSCSYILYRWLVYDIPNKTRIKILEIIQHMLQHGNITDALYKKLMLKPDLFPAVGELLCKQDISRDVVVHLMKLAISVERSAEARTDIYKDFSIVLSVVRVSHVLPRPVKLEIAIKIRHSLKLSSQSAHHCADELGWYEPIWKLILKENNSPTDMDVMEAELVQVVIEIIHIVMWRGIDGSDTATWRKRSEPLCSLHFMSSRNTFLLPVLVIERQLYEMCLEASAQGLTESMQPYAVDSQNAVQILKLIEVFLGSKEISAVESQKWSTKLLNNIFTLLDAMNAWDDSTEGGCEWVEVLQIVERILYQCCMQTNKDLVETANYKLVQLLHKRVVVQKEEASYQIYHINAVITWFNKLGISYENLLLVLLQRFERFGAFFFEEGYLQNLPPMKPSVFKKDFVDYMKDDEFQNFLEALKLIAMKFEYDNFSDSPLSVDRLWMDSLSAMTSATQNRQMLLEESLHNFCRTIYYDFDEKRNEELKQLDDYKRTCRQRNGLTKKSWTYQKRFLKSERGAWGCRKHPDVHWRLSNTENRYRMRLKLTENLKYNSHVDAARNRDVTNAPDVLRNEENLVSLPLSIDSEENVVSDDEERLISPNNEEDEEETEQASHLYDFDGVFDGTTGSCIHFSQCRLVTLMDVVYGRIELTASHVCFYDEDEATTDAPFDFRFSLEELREIYSRRYNLRKTAVEFFLLDRSSYFINFLTEKDKEEFYRKLTARKPKNLYYSGIQNPAKLLRVSKLTNKWVDREISNFEYLMQLNTISGRTYNDLAQYPVFPWILIDYTSDSIDLNDESIYRDLLKPVGALNERKAKEIKNRYDTFVDVSGLTQKSHYFTHYSNPGGVLHYMVRVEPFTSLHVRLQGGKFDCADRQFYSIAKAWRTVESGSDVKELIPEFFFFPECFTNMNAFNFGCLQRNGERVDDVLLPPWAKDPYDFINIHRQALESEYVSANLHHWIDLIFGYKQRGKEAEKALNVFSHYTYEGAVDLDKIEDPVLREATEGMINNFGQTPTQLLKKSHPRRKTLQELDSLKPKVFNNIESSTFSLIEINNAYMSTPTIFIAACKPRPKSILYQAVPDSLVTVHLNGLVGIHAWLPFADTKTNSFSFTMDVLLASPSSHAQRALPGAISQSMELSSKLFAFTSDGHLMLSCGYWDNSIRLVNTDRGRDKLKTCVCHHNDVVTCICLDVDGSHLISGSADLTCAVWKIEQNNGFSASLSKQPVQTLYGHDSCITAVVMYGDLDLAVSGDKDGTCLVHTIRRGIFTFALNPTHPKLGGMGCCVIQVKLSEQGRIVVLSNVKHVDTPHHFFSVYSVNGALLANVNLGQVVLDMCIVNDYLITGSMSGILQIRHVNDLSTTVLSKNVRSPIFTVAGTHNGSHIFIGRGDGNILVMCPSKI